LPHIELGPHRIEYAVVRGTSRRYTYFRFRPNLTLEVKLPRGRPVDVMSEIRMKSSWLKREYERLSRTKSVLSHESIMLGGEQFSITYVPSAGDQLTPDLTNKEVIVHTSHPRRIKELVRRWFLKESSAYAIPKVAELAKKLGVRPTRVDVRQIGKWGYCTREGRISLSWQLIALPERLREYVLLHELTHLIEFNHSPAFKRRLASVCPDFRDREKELDLVVPYEMLGPPG
jgi:predicted metal-dependent hydrolase